MRSEPTIIELYDKDLYRNAVLTVSLDSLVVDYLSAEKTTATILSLNYELLEKIKETTRYATIREMFSGTVLYNGIVNAFYKDGTHYSVDILPMLSIFDTNFGCGFGQEAAQKVPAIGTTAGQQLQYAMLGLFGAIGAYPTMQDYELYRINVFLDGTTPKNNGYISKFESKNIFESCGDMLKLFNIRCDSEIKKSGTGPNPDGSIDFTISTVRNTIAKRIDTRLSNVLALEVEDGAKNSINVLYMADEDSYPAAGSVQGYIRYDNGAITFLNGGDAGASRINPRMDFISGDDLQNVNDIAQSTLTLENYDITVRVTIKKDDKLTPLSVFAIGDSVNVITETGSYSLQLTAYEVKGKQVTYTFGNGRQTLTQKIREERTK